MKRQKWKRPLLKRQSGRGAYSKGSSPRRMTPTLTRFLPRNPCKVTPVILHGVVSPENLNPESRSPLYSIAYRGGYTRIGTRPARGFHSRGLFLRA